MLHPELLDPARYLIATMAVGLAGGHLATGSKRLHEPGSGCLHRPVRM